VDACLSRAPRDRRGVGDGVGGNGLDAYLSGHLISLHGGHTLGLSDAELASDDNLAAMCVACNSGLFSESLPPRLLAAALWARANGGRRAARPERRCRYREHVLSTLCAHLRISELISSEVNMQISGGLAG
jgi:hypothetical protein